MPGIEVALMSGKVDLKQRQIGSEIPCKRLSLAGIYIWTQILYDGDIYISIIFTINTPYNTEYKKYHPHASFHLHEAHTVFLPFSRILL